MNRCKLFHQDMGTYESASHSDRRTVFHKVTLSKEGASFFQLLENTEYDIHVDLANAKVIVYFGDIITREFEWTI
jgi:hypothetical protein